MPRLFAGQYVFVFGNGKVDRSEVSSALAERIQLFVDTRRRSPKGVACIVEVDDTTFALYEMTSMVVIDSDDPFAFQPTNW